MCNTYIGWVCHFGSKKLKTILINVSICKKMKSVLSDKTIAWELADNYIYSSICITCGHVLTCNLIIPHNSDVSYKWTKYSWNHYMYNVSSVSSSSILVHCIKIVIYLSKHGMVHTWIIAFDLICCGIYTLHIVIFEKKNEFTVADNIIRQHWLLICDIYQNIIMTTISPRGQWVNHFTTQVC